jgi:hypothetical protein
MLAFHLHRSSPHGYDTDLRSVRTEPVCKSTAEHACLSER